jgi:hypothetical protein
MNLGESLSLLKKEKSRLVRLISLRKENVFIEKGKKSEFDLESLSDEIDKKIDEIRILKVKIQNTNINTIVSGEKISLAEVIIKVGDIRSKISILNSLFERKRGSWFFDKDQRELAAKINESDVEDEIERLETEKTRLDNKIQITNWNTQLLN